MSQRISTHLKSIRGTLKPCRLPKQTAGERLTKAPAPPHSLSELAAKEWLELAPVAVELGVLTPADLRAFALLCETLASESELRAVLKTEGLTIAGAESSKAHPATKLLQSTRAQAMRLLDAFGLTPHGRQGVDIKPPRDEEETLWQKLIES